MRVIVTAFESFNKKDNNYSKEVLKYITCDEKVVLDVCYDLCYEELISKYNLDDFDLIVSLGEARSREYISLETTAKNISSCSICDNRGVYKKDEVIRIDKPDKLNTLVNIDLVKDLIVFSYDAGKYVCNNLYFHLLANLPSKSIFIHVPNCYDLESEYIKYANVINSIIKALEV